MGELEEEDNDPGDDFDIISLLLSLAPQLVKPLKPGERPENLSNLGNSCEGRGATN